MDVLSEFEFEIKYIPGETNTVADALSRMYSEDRSDQQRHALEHIHEEGINQDLPIIPLGSRATTMDAVDTQ